MDQHPDALAPMRAALAATDAAARAVVLELDYWTGMTPSFVMPTSLLIKLDAWREAEAQMFQFLPSPGITSAQTERAWKHAIEQAEALTAGGPTQDQEPCSICGFKQDQEPMTIEQQYDDGLLSLEEYNRLAAEDAREIEEDTCAMQGCINPFKPGYIVCEEHYQAMQHEAANIEEPMPAPPRVQWLPGGAMIFADPQNKMPF